MKVKSESEVAQSCPTLSDRMDCGLPGSSIHGIFQARVLEGVAIAFWSSEMAADLGFRRPGFKVRLFDLVLLCANLSELLCTF